MIETAPIFPAPVLLPSPKPRADPKTQQDTPKASPGPSCCLQHSWGGWAPGKKFAKNAPDCFGPREPWLRLLRDPVVQCLEEGAGLHFDLALTYDLIDKAFAGLGRDRAQLLLQVLD